MNPSPAPDPGECYLTTPQLAKLLNCHRKSIPRMVARKNLPPPTRLNARSVRWLLSDVRRWMEKRRKPA